jgi:VWFA-related protein
MLALWHPRPALLFLALLICGPDTHGSNDPAESTTYRTTVSEVQVTFFATDEQQHPVATLTNSDFAVIDNERVVRNFHSFSRSDETSLEVVVLVDASQSVAPRFQFAMKNVAQLVAYEQAISDDDISVLVFGGTSPGPNRERSGVAPNLQPAILCSSGCRTSESVSKLLAVANSGTTPLFDALIFGAAFISQNRRAGVRPVLILFSDGIDTISLHSSLDAIQAVTDGGVSIYSVDVGSPRNPTTGTAFLRQISEATGGRYFSMSSRHDNSASLLSVVHDDLRASYVVTYDLPSHQAGFHALRLLPTHDLNLTFHSRNGYYYEPSLR